MLGARNHYALPEVLHSLGRLNRLYTDLYLGNKRRFLQRIALDHTGLLRNTVQRLRGRIASSVPAERVQSFDVLGLGYALERRLVRDDATRVSIAVRYARWINERACRMHAGSGRILWGFNGAALEVFEHTRAGGGRCILDQVIVSHQTMLELIEEERRRWPGWDASIEPLRVSRGSDPISMREAREWELADLIAVPSEFVKGGSDESRSDGAKTALGSLRVTRPRSPNGARCTRLVDDRRNGTNVLFLGQIGLRKGVPYLLEALRKISNPDIHTRLVGSVAINRGRAAPVSVGRRDHRASAARGRSSGTCAGPTCWFCPRYARVRRWQPTRRLHTGFRSLRPRMQAPWSATESRGG